MGSSPKTAAKQQPQLLTDGFLRGTAVAQIIHAAFQVAHRCLDALAAACVQRLCNGSVNAWVPETWGTKNGWTLRWWETWEIHGKIYRNTWFLSWENRGKDGKNIGTCWTYIGKAWNIMKTSWGIIRNYRKNMNKNPLFSWCFHGKIIEATGESNPHNCRNNPLVRWLRIV